LARIIIENGPDKGKEVPLRAGDTLVIGRDARAGLAVPDERMSGSHFRIVAVEDECRVEDTGSQGGTFLNDQRLTEPARLAPGDKILAGETVFTFLENGGTERRGLVGKAIGGYQINERIGRGGMGTVYRATQLSLSREVALKVLSSNLTQDPTFVDRFLREARAAGQLNHPHIVQVYDVGKDKDLYFYSMEFISKGSVQDRLNQEARLPVEEALRVLQDAARGLQYAEKKGVVHRDIKPDNLMITEDGTVKIADLGLAQTVGENNRKEGILGTPHFISPEQAQGKPVDSRSDLYSLGASLYRMLAGRTPFEGSNVKDLILKQIRENPPALREVAADVPEDVADLVQRLMKKDPAERFANASELLTVLEEIQRRHHYRMSGAPRRRALAFTLGTLVLAGAGVAGWVFLRPPPPEPQPPTPPAPLVAGPEVPPRSTGPDPADPKTMAEVRAKDAHIKFLEAEGFEKEHPVSKEAVERYTAVATAFADTEWGQKASARARKLDQEILKRSAAETEARQKLEQRYTALETRVLELIRGWKFLEALAVLEEPETRSAFQGTPYAEKHAAWSARVLEEARAAFAKLETDAGALEQGGSFAEAGARWSHAAGALAAATEAQPALLELKKKAAGEADRLRAASEERELKRYEGDRTLAYRALQDAAAAEARCDFVAAEAALRAANGQVATPEYRARLQRTLDEVARASRLKAALLEKGAAGGLNAERFPLPAEVMGAREATLEKVSADGFTVNIRLGATTSSRAVERWERYCKDGDRLFQVFKERWKMTPEEHLGLATLALRLRLYAEAEAEAEAAAQAGEPTRAAVGALRQRIGREREAAKLLADAEKALDEKRWPDLSEATAALRDRYADTDVYFSRSNGTTHLAPGVKARPAAPPPAPPAPGKGG
jgi:hypothetical protein